MTTASLHNLPTSDEFLASSRRRRMWLAVGGILLALLVGVSFVGVGKDTPLAPLALLLAVLTPVVLWRYPRACLYILFGAACLFELGRSDFRDSLTDSVPFFWNVNTIFQVYAHQNVKAIPLNVMEVFALTAGICSVFRTVFSRSVDVRGGPLLAPIGLYLAFVAAAWGWGMATHGDFKISLQEVRSQFYFGIAYLLAVNSLRDRAQLGVLLKVFVACVGLKGVLLTFRRYVTLHGLPVPDQGVGAHEEAFFFDTFAVLLAVLALCGAHKRLQRVMWCLLPFVQLGNLACNRRAATAALVVVVPVLIACAIRVLPARRRLVVRVTVAFVIGFSVYFSLFRYSSSFFAQPARAIQSQIAPDPRDASSNAYRDAENADLMATIKSAPLGYGYGKRMLHAVPIADISTDYEWWDVMTHNQILWVWMRVGTLGFVAFWLMVSAILIQGCLTIRTDGADAETKAVGLFAMLTVGMLMIFGLLDLQLSNFRDMLFAGFWSGALAFLGLGAAQKRAVFSATGAGFYGYAGKMGLIPPSLREKIALTPQPPLPQAGEGEQEGSADIGKGGFGFPTPNPRPLAGEGGAKRRVRAAEDAAQAVSADTAPAAAPRVARNVATTLATQLLSWGMTFVVTLYLPRYIGDVGLGILTLAASIASVFSLLVGLGTSTVLIKDIARDHGRAGELALASLALRLPLGLAAVGMGWGASFLMGYDAHLRMLIVVALGVMAISQMTEALGCVLRGLEEIPRQNAAALAERVVTSALTIVMVIVRAPLVLIIGVAAVGSLASLSVVLASLRRHITHVARPSGQTIKAMVMAGMPFLTTAVFMAVYGQADALLLSKLSSVQAIGWYGLAKRLGGSTMVIPVALGTAMLPTLARLWESDRDQFAVSVRRLWNLMLIAVVPFAAILGLAPARILALLHYPASFAPSVPVLMLMGGAVVLWFLSQVAGVALIASDSQGAVSRITGIAALLSVPVCAACIWGGQHLLHNGAVGAMLSDVLVEGYLLLAYLRTLPPNLLDGRGVLILARALLAALPLVGLFHFVHSAAGLLWLVPGLIAYLPLCLALGCLSAQDVQALRNLFLRKMRAR